MVLGGGGEGVGQFEGLRSPTRRQSEKNSGLGCSGDIVSMFLPTVG